MLQLEYGQVCLFSAKRKELTCLKICYILMYVYLQLQQSGVDSSYFLLFVGEGKKSGLVALASATYDTHVRSYSCVPIRLLYHRRRNINLPGGGQ